MNKKGFTLIELVSVIIIISLLIILVLPKVTDAVKNHTKETDKLMLTMIKDATKLYVQDNSDIFIKKNGGNYCVLISDLVKEDYLKGPIEYQGENITNTKGLKVKYNDGFEYELTDLYNGSCTLANYITNLYSETTTTTVNEIEYSLDETHSLMNDRLGSSDVDKTEGNIRYYGANPNNYIDIGDRDSDGNIIFWRIIGLFKDIEVTNEDGNVVKTQDLVKIIRADNIGAFSWDYTAAAEYDNNWHDSTLQVMLNNAYYNSGTTNYYNKSTTPITLNFNSTGLSSNTHSKIERVNWSLGDKSSPGVYVDVMYNYEMEGSNSWSGKIVIMSMSDYGYSVDLNECQYILKEYGNTMCTETNWMYNSSFWHWTLNPYSGRVDVSSGVLQTGAAEGFYTSDPGRVRPTLYLNSDVAIVDEKVTSDGIKYFVVE